MKIYISADFEGVCGVVARRQCFPGDPDFERARRHWVEEINAIIEGAMAAGASEFVVNEAHAAMNYMLPSCFIPKPRLSPATSSSTTRWKGWMTPSQGL